MKLLFYIAIFNIAGVVLSILYGIYGGSGGETTTGVFLGIAFVGILTVIMCFALLFFQFDLFKSKWYWFLILIVIGIVEASIVDWKTILGLN
ncbi:MAG: hypothetical protein GC178_18270 [Flavobacteriales bacterium]|nr:hypothetical protein [Flavobacteriales bacterium]